MILPLLVAALSLVVQYFFPELTLKDYFPVTVFLLYKAGGWIYYAPTSIFQSLPGQLSRDGRAPEAS